MNLYEHTIIARQDTSPSQLKQITDKYLNIVEKNKGEVIQTQNWGLINLAYIINKNRKGNYIHFKIKGPSSLIVGLEKSERMDKNLLRYLTVKVKNFDLDTNYFSSKEENDLNYTSKKITPNAKEKK